LDRLLLVWDTGRYQMVPPPDKLFVDKNLIYFGIFDRDKVFTLVYNSPTTTFLKRFAFGGAIMNRDYNCAQEDAKVKYLSDRAVSEIRLRYRHAKPSNCSLDQLRIHLCHLNYDRGELAGQTWAKLALFVVGEQERLV